MNVTQAKFIKLGQPLAVAHALGLVGHENARFSQAAQIIGDVMVLRRQAFACIHDKHHDIGLGHGLAGLSGHFAVDAAFTCIRFEATGVYDDEFAPSDAAVAIVAIAGQSGIVGHDGVTRFGEAVE